MAQAAPAVERMHPPTWLINHLVNPVTRRMLRHDGKIAEEILLLRFEGRKTGNRYEIPIAYRQIGERLALFTNRPWRHNFHGGRDVEITLHGDIRKARATLVDDPQQVARVFENEIEELGLEDARRSLGIKVHVDRDPTLEELADMARRSRTSIVWLDLQP